MRIVTAIVSFALGLGFVGFFRADEVQAPLNSLKISQGGYGVSVKSEYVRDDGEIEVRFSGFGEKDGEQTVKVKVINHNSRQAGFSSYWNSSPGWSYFRFNSNVDGLKLFCSTGLEEFYLEPGETIEDEIVLSLFATLKLSDIRLVEIGYFFKLRSGKEQIFWSKPQRVNRGSKRKAEK